MVLKKCAGNLAHLIELNWLKSHHELKSILFTYFHKYLMFIVEPGFPHYLWISLWIHGWNSPQTRENTLDLLN
jgi:hypothetical protein